MMWFTLAGIMGVRKPPLNQISSEPNIVLSEDVIAIESKRFSEIRLLQREILLDVGGFDVQNKMIYGVIIHPIGKCISQELVKNGLAKVVDWSVVRLFLSLGLLYFMKVSGEIKLSRGYKKFETKEKTRFSKEGVMGVIR
jgi:hypothetical protein